jgi:hypothetical protein
VTAGRNDRERIARSAAHKATIGLAGSNPVFRSAEGRPRIQEAPSFLADPIQRGQPGSRDMDTELAARAAAGSISPLEANLYPHCVFDLWVQPHCLLDWCVPENHHSDPSFALSIHYALQRSA